MSYIQCICLLTLSGVLILGACIGLFLGNVRAGRILHARLLRNIVGSPMTFFDTTPLGRILNRFSKDLDVIDSLIAVNFQAWIVCMLRTLVVPVIIGYSTPYFIAIAIPLFIGYFVIQVSSYTHNRCGGVKGHIFLFFEITKSFVNIFYRNFACRQRNNRYETYQTGF